MYVFEQTWFQYLKLKFWFVSVPIVSRPAYFGVFKAKPRIIYWKITMNHIIFKNFMCEKQQCIYPNKHLGGN